MDHLERAYLVAAYGLARSDAMHSFQEDDVAAYLDLNPNDPGFADHFISVTRYHLDMGFVEPFHKGGGMGRRALRLTRQGLQEGERLSDPVEQRKELRGRFIRAVYDLADGDPAAFVGWEEVAPLIGLDASNAEQQERGIALAEYAEHAGLIVMEADEGTLYRITAKGVDQVEGNRPEPQQNVTNTWNLSGNFYQSAIGTHNTNTFSGDLDFSTVERRIEAEGGADKEELRKIVAEMRQLLERGGPANQGFLARFNAVLKKYDWLAGAVAGWLLNLATRGG